MIELPLPTQVERQLVGTSRREVLMLRGLPRPEDDNGTDVVMVSGFFGTKEDFRELLSLLARAGYRGWAYDYLGQLGPVEADIEYSIAYMAGDLLAVLRAVGAGRPAHLVGHCLGGFVARAAAVREPALARSLTLMACGPSMRDRKHKAMLSGLAQLHTNGGAIALWPLVKALLAEDDTVMREFWHAKLSAMNPLWVTGTAESMGDEQDRSAELTAAGIPSLVVHGKRDRRLWSADAYGEMAQRLGAERVVIERASHSPNMEQPVVLAETLLEFWGARRRDGQLVAAAL
ncbi:MAG: alpha/beta fold hydrolase [Streptosporangiaceae bacterium]